MFVQIEILIDFQQTCDFNSPNLLPLAVAFVFNITVYTMSKGQRSGSPRLNFCTVSLSLPFSYSKPILAFSELLAESQ